MQPLINYPLNEDAYFYKSIKHTVGNRDFKISAITQAGRREFDSPQKPNEDAFSVSILNETLLCALFDGTSSLKPIVDLKDQTGARFASHFVKKACDQQVSGLSPKEIIRELNTSLLAETLKFRGTSLSDTHTLPATTATILQLDPQQQVINVSHVGDSFCLVYYQNKQCEFITIDKNRLYDDRIFELMKQVAAERNISHKEARQDDRVKQALLDMFQDSHNKNDGTGQGLLNGDPNVHLYIQDITLPMNDIDMLFIGSDGIIPPGFDEQNPDDQQKIFTILKVGGLQELIRLKNEIENNDPDRTLIRYKHSDDATGIVIEL